MITKFLIAFLAITATAFFQNRVFAQGYYEVCVGETSTLSLTSSIGVCGAPNFVSWETDPGGGSISESDPPSGSFTVTWTTAGRYRLKRTFSGCTQVAHTEEFTVHPKPATPTTNQVSQTPGNCAQVTLNYSGTANAYWQTSSSDFDLTYPQSRLVSSTGTYYARIKDANECWSDSRSIVVSSVPASPVGGSLSGSGTYTQKANLNLQLTNWSGSIKEYRYSENGGSSQLVTGTNSQIEVNFSATTSTVIREYWAVVQLNGCEVNSARATLTVNPPPIPTLHACTGTVSTMSLNRDIGCGYGKGSTASWDGADGGSINDPDAFSSSFTVTWGAPGIYRLKRTFPSGCMATVIYSEYIEVLGPPEVDITPSGTLKIASTASQLISATTSTGFTYIWKRNGTYLQNESGSAITATDAGIYSVEVDRYGCGDVSPTLSLSKNIAPVVTVGPNQELIQFPGTTTTIIGTASDADGSIVSYLWNKTSGPSVSTSGANGAVLSLSNLQAGTYSFTLTVTDNFGESKTSNVVNVIVTHIDNNYNFVSTSTVLKTGVTNAATVNNLPIGEKMQTTSYFDGLGRPIQTVSVKGSPGSNPKDIVNPVVYDAVGREAVKYLPFVAEENGWFKENVIDANGTYINSAAGFYSNEANTIADDAKPFAKTVFEPSPLNRVIEQGAPGAVWQPGTNHTIKKEYLTNGANEVLSLSFTSDAGLLAQVNYYSANQLTCTRTIDEEQNDVLEYVDKEGHTICKKVKADTGVYASTYYIYDDFGNLVIVLPPEAVKRFLAQNGN